MFPTLTLTLNLINEGFKLTTAKWIQIRQKCKKSGIFSEGQRIIFSSSVLLSFSAILHLEEMPVNESSFKHPILRSFLSFCYSIFFSLSHPSLLWRPSRPHQGPFCSSPMWRVSAYPSKVNQTLNVRTFVCVCTLHPTNFLLLSPTYLCPTDKDWLLSQCIPLPPSPRVDFSGP